MSVNTRNCNMLQHLLSAYCGIRLTLLGMATGSQLVVSSHGPALHILGGLDGADAASLQPPHECRQLLELTQLPLRCIAFLSETSLVGAGFDGQVGPWKRIKHV